MSFQGPNLDIAKIKTDRAIIDQVLQLEVEKITAAGAVSVSVPCSVIASAGAIALTLANGKPGQIKIIWMMTDGGTATLTPTNLYNGTTVAFDDVNDAWIGIFYAGEWHTILAGSLGATIA